MDRQRVFDCLKALGYTDRDAHELIYAEVVRRERAKEGTFKEKTEELLRGMDL